MLHFIVNPKSRSGMGQMIWEKLQMVLDESSTPYQCHLTSYAGHAVEIARHLSGQAQESSPISIVIVGGDGTLNEVIGGLQFGEYVTIGYIPTGSGNDFCRGLSLLSTPGDALTSILNACPLRTMNYGAAHTPASCHRFAVSAGIGFDASVCVRIASSKLKKVLNRIHCGKFVYLLIGVSQIFLEKQSPAVITIDGKTVINAKKLFFLSAHVTPYEGGGFRFAPHAKPDDSLLSLCIFYDMTKFGCLIALILSLFGKHARKKGVLTVNCKSVTIKTPVLRNVHTDGEILGYLSDITLENGPETYSLLYSAKESLVK